MRLERVVVGVDFGESSRRAAAWVARLAPDAAVRLVHALELPRTPRLLGGELAGREEIERALRLGAEERLETLALELPRPVERDIRVGRPHEVLADVAAAWDADLAVVGGHGEQRGVWKLLGSTVEHLIHDSRVAVLVARGLPAGPPRTVLVPVDESPPAARALRWAGLLSGLHGSRVVAFHAVSTWYSSQVERVASRAAADELQRDLERKSRAWLAATVDEAGLPHGADLEVRSGPPFLEVTAAAAREGADLIVMGSRGAGGVRAHLLGSVARALLHSCDLPVLVVERDG